MFEGLLKPDNGRRLYRAEEMMLKLLAVLMFVPSLMGCTSERKDLTWVGDEQDVDRCIAEMLEFKAAGVTELAIRLYDDPEESIRLIAERVMPALA